MKNLFLTLLFLPLFTHGQVIVTCAGDGTAGYCCDRQPATAAELDDPSAVALDDTGNLYICDLYLSRIRKVSPAYGGIITTYAGTGTGGYSGDGGPAIFAQILHPLNIATDHHGNVFFVDGNERIRKINSAGIITTVAGTGTAGYNGDGIPATAAQLSAPIDLTVDNTGNIYIVDYGNFRIRKVDTAGIIHTIAGTGIDGFSPDGSIADTSKIGSAWCIKINDAGVIYFGDSARIRQIDTSGIITTVAGNGIDGFSPDGSIADTSKIAVGGGIFLDTHGNLYIADAEHVVVRMVNLADGAGAIIKTIAGNGIGGFSGDGGPPLLAEFSSPSGIVVDDSDDVYIGDRGNSRVRLITKHPLQVKNIAPNSDAIDVYPNPCYDHYTIQTNSADDDEVQVSITDIMGVEVSKYKMRTNQPYTFQTDLPPGVYCITAITSRQQLYRKLIIQ